MAAPLYLTKGELRDKLLIRLGYGGLGSAAGKFVPMADDLLEEAQDVLFQALTDDKGIREWEFYTGVNQRWYDIPDTCDIDQILGMYAQQNGDYWHPLIRGIGPAHDSDYADIDDYPYRYDIRASLGNEGVNEMVNGDMGVDDSSASGIAGFTWSPSSSWSIAGGKASCAFAGTSALQSTSIPTVGQRYLLSYTITGADVSTVTFGGTGVDEMGTLLPASAGAHEVVVIPVFAGALLVVAVGVDAALSSVSLKKKALDSSISTKIEVWPKPDAAYLMKIEGPMVVGPFVKDSDRASFDSRLVLLYAIAFGKDHLGKRDAKSAMDAWMVRLKQIKANQHGTKEYVRKNPNTPEISVRARPRVV